MNKITARAIELWQKIPADQIGGMPHSYNIRVKLHEQFPDETTTRISNCSMQAVRILKKGNPLTTAEKQTNRNTALDEIARAAGWSSWSEYATAVKRGVVSIAPPPDRDAGSAVAESRATSGPRWRCEH